MAKSRLMVIGLDCLEPSLAFDLWADKMPVLSSLRERGLWGLVRSTDPPITVPAWMCMMTGRDPGELGIYGFRNRKSYDYEDLVIPTSKNIKYPTVWEELSRQGKRCIVLGVPLTYPAKPLNGKLAACFLTPSKDHPWTYPNDFSAELEQLAGGEYIIDVRDFRTTDKQRLLDQIYQMTKARFQAAELLAAGEEWDFLMLVEMGPDRLHHGFWRYHDTKHRLYDPESQWRHAIRDYYVYLDQCLERMLWTAGPETNVIVVSDHGAQRMEGAICINEWLEKEGYLTFKHKPSAPVKFTREMVDWSRTKAWGEGGYYARIFMNVAGREPQGIIPPDEYESERKLLRKALEDIRDPEGKNIGTVAFTPEELYRKATGIPPDLTVYLGDLSWRSAGTVGHNQIHLFENDTGPDDANHSKFGLLAAAGPRIKPGGQQNWHILDLKKMILNLFEL